MWFPACLPHGFQAGSASIRSCAGLSKTAIHTDVVASGLTGVWLASRCHGVAGPCERALVEDAGAPKDDVRTDDLLDDVHDVGMGGDIQPARARFETFEAASRNMRTHHVVIRESWIVLNQLQGQRLQLGDVLFGQPVRRNDESVAVIASICSALRIRRAGGI
jgi:hypothetical protein